jgi:PAS domain S-box-containing protein
MDFDAENQNLIGIFTTDADFIVRVWDAALERMTGISAETARGKSIAEIIPNLETRGLLTRFKRVLDEGTIEILAPAFHRCLISCEPQFASQHFTEMRQRVTIAPLRENESIRGLMVTIEDVTERMESEMRLAAQLEDSDETARLQAAKAIATGQENLGEENAAPLINALGDKSWRVRRELVQGLSRRAAPEAIAALLRALREQHFDFGVLNSALQVLQATSVKTTETLVEFLRGGDADLRMQAALTLGEQKDAQAIPALLAALADENVNVRYHAVEALGKLKAREAVESLLALAETDDFFLAFAALDALREIADESITLRILPLVSVDFLREAALKTLGAIGNEEIVSALVALLNEEKSSAIAVAGALETLFARYESDSAKSSAVIERARRSINDEGKANLRDALDQAGEADLISLVRLAGRFDDESLRRKLADLVENENAREEAARALARHGETAVELFLEKLDAGDYEVRRTIVRALGELKTGRGVPALIEILETDSEIAVEAARSLGQIGDARAFEPLVDLLETGDAGSRQAAVGALKSLAHPDTVARLCALLADSDANVREAAIRVVGQFGAKGCEAEIFECCKDKEERVRKAAVEQLPQIADERVVPVLVRVLKEDSPRVRAAAAQALGHIESDEGRAALREALSDADAWTRYFAIRALGALQDVASREIFVEMAETDEAEQVRAAAREVLSGLKI